MMESIAVKERREDDDLYDLGDSVDHDKYNTKEDENNVMLSLESESTDITRRKIENLKKSLEQISRDVWNYSAYEETTTTTTSSSSSSSIDEDDLCQYLFCHDGVLIQRDLEERLENIENQLSCLFPEQGQKEEETNPTTSNNQEDSVMDTATFSELSQDDTSGILFPNNSKDSNNWKWKVSFLQFVTKARMAMEEITSPSTSTSDRTSKDNDCMTAKNNQDVTPSNNFDNIQKAQKYIQLAEQELYDLSKLSSSNHDSDSSNMEYEMAQRLLTSIRHQWQRLKVDTMTTFEKLWKDDNSLIIQSNQLSILSESCMKPIILYSIDKKEYAIALAQRVHSIVFQPVLDQHIEYCKKQLLVSTSTQSSSVIVLEPNTSWQMRETKTNNKGHKKKNSTMMTLEWRQRTTTTTDNNHKHTPPPPPPPPPKSPSSEDDGNNTIDCYYDMQRMNNCLESFLEVLQFVKHICQYCYDHFLFRQSGLSQIVGSIWYPKTARSSGSFKQSDELLQDDEEVFNVTNNGSNNYYRQDFRNNTASPTSPLQSQLLQLLWTTCLPRTNDSSLVWNAVTNKWKQKLITGILELQTCLDECQFIVLSQKNKNNEKQSDWILMQFANQYERKHGEKQQSMILQEGRQLLLETDYHNTVPVGVDVTSTMNKNDQNNFNHSIQESKTKNDYYPEELDSMEIFLLHQCHVSQVVQNLMKLCRKTMEKSVQSFAVIVTKKELETLSFLPPLLYRTTRELLDLYRAIIPAAHGNEIFTIPRTAAIHYNDCVYLAHEMLTFGLEYRDRFEQANAQNTDSKKSSSSNSVSTLAQLLPLLSTFVDLVPPFRELADRTMVNMIQRQKHILADIVQEKIGENENVLASMFKCQEPVVEWSDAETALHAGIYHLQHLSQAWKPPILSHDVYRRVIGNLVDTLFVLFLDPVQKARDISEPACHFISALFSNAIRNTSTLFEYNNDDYSNKEEEKNLNAQKYSQIWTKFFAVGKFMDMSTLTDIQFALSEGVFRSVTGPELSSLITAVFDDSDKRKHLLSLLAPESNR